MITNQQKKEYVLKLRSEYVQKLEGYVISNLKKGLEPMVPGLCNVFYITSVRYFDGNDYLQKWIRQKLIDFKKQHETAEHLWTLHNKRVSWTRYNRGFAVVNKFFFDRKDPKTRIEFLNQLITELNETPK